MFKLIALLFLVSNGVQSEKPSGVITHKETFASADECKTFLGSKKGIPTKKALEGMVQSQKGKLAIGIACVKVEKNNDNSI